MDAGNRRVGTARRPAEAVGSAEWRWWRQAAGGRSNYGGGTEGGLGPQMAQDRQSRWPVWRRLRRWQWQVGAARRNDDIPQNPAFPVVHVRGLGDAVSRRTLWRPCGSLAPISSVVVMPKRRQALVEFERVGGLQRHELRNRQPDLAGGLRSFYQLFLSARKISRPGTWMTPKEPTVGFSLPSEPPSIPLPWKFFILSVTLEVLSRELWFYKRMASRPWWTLCSVPGD